MRPVVAVALSVLGFASCLPSAWAINKCTAADGKVVYQAALCADSTKAKDQVKTWNVSSAPDSGGWRFERRTDSMTGAVSCHAISPATWISSGPRKTTDVHAEVVLQTNTAALLILGSTPTEIFHHDLRGTGIKVNSYAFVPITKKLKANAVGFADIVDPATLILKVFPTAENFKLRLRFWPWDELHDTSEPITLNGFKQAFALAQQCSK